MCSADDFTELEVRVCAFKISAIWVEHMVRHASALSKCVDERSVELAKALEDVHTGRGKRYAEEATEFGMERGR